MRFDTQAGAKPENCAGILGNVRLVKGDPHGGPGDVPVLGIKRLRRMIYAANSRRRGRTIGQSVTFKARPDAKPVSTFAGRALAGLRSLGKGANRTPPTRCPAFSRAAATGPPRRRGTSVPGSSRGRMNKPAGGEGLRRDDRVFRGAHAPRLSLYRHRRRRRGGGRGRAGAADRADESGRLDHRGRRADRGRSRRRSPTGRSSRCSGARKPIFIFHRTKKEIEEARKVNVAEPSRSGSRFRRASKRAMISGWC